MGLFAMGTRAFGNSFGFDVNVFSDTPGPHKIRAWKPVKGSVACGMLDGDRVVDSSSESVGTAVHFMLLGKKCPFLIFNDWSRSASHE
jgi:hypothetical protein